MIWRDSCISSSRLFITQCNITFQSMGMQWQEPNAKSVQINLWKFSVISTTELSLARVGARIHYNWLCLFTGGQHHQCAGYRFLVHSAVSPTHADKQRPSGERHACLSISTGNTYSGQLVRAGTKQTCLTVPICQSILVCPCPSICLNARVMHYFRQITGNYFFLHTG